MLRIIAGSLGGRKIKASDSKTTHPMSEKLRGAIFNALGDIEGLSVIDAYAGSGAVGFEAISRGASRVLALENDRPAINIIRLNEQPLDLGPSYQLIQLSVEHWLSQTTTSSNFEIIIADPPYDKLDVATIEQLAARLSEKGILVLSHTSKIPAPQLKSVELVRTKGYGDASLSYYKKTS